MKKLTISLVLLSLLLVAFSPIWATVNHDVTVRDFWSGENILLEQGTLVSVDGSRQGGGQTWYHISAYQVFPFVKISRIDAWIPETALDW